MAVDKHSGLSNPSSAEVDESYDDIEKKAYSNDHAVHSGKTSKSSSACPSEEEQDEDQDNVLSFEPDDPLNPHNWRRSKKMFVTIACMFLVTNSTFGSSLPSGSADVMAKYFNIHNESLLVLPVSIYLIGYVLGPLVFPPLSEAYGRKVVMVSTFTLFTASILGCALAPNFAALIIFRLLTGIGASTPVSVIGGIYADVWSSSKARGRAVAVFMACTTFGPLLGPVASGFSAPVSWRWSYWIALIFAGATWPLLLCIPETYGPIILRRKARKLRKDTGDNSIRAPIELEKRDLRELVTVTLTRPVRMFLFEAIVLCSCLYLALAYGIFYIYFQAFPIIFRGIYGFNAGEEGLCFIPIGIGSLLACLVYLWWDHYLDKARQREPMPEWVKQEEYRRLPIACVAAPLFVIPFFWFGWTARADIHWIVPVIASLPWGIGFLLLFMALVNYIVDAYEVYAASAMGASSASRSLVAVVLPFGARPMYENMGVAWACSLLGFLSLAMSVIPFVFIKYGDRIRANSKFCQELKAKKEQDNEKQRRQSERRESQRKAQEAQESSQHIEQQV